MELVSIVMTAYNAEKYVKFTLDSIESQTYKNFEVIIFDDGSTDKTIEIIESFKEKIPVTLVRNEHIGNVGKHRNSAIKISKGSLIAFIDADDIWEKNKLEFFVSNIGKYDLISSNASVIDQNNTHVRNKYFENYNSGFEILLKNLVEINFVLTSSVMIKKSIFSEACCFDEEVGIRGEDYIFWLKICRKGKAYFFNDALLKYRFHSSNLSFQSPFERIELLLRTISIRKSYFDYKEDLEVRKNSKLGCLLLYIELIKIYLKLKNYSKALEYLSVLKNEGYKIELKTRIKMNLTYYFLKGFKIFRRF